MSALEKPEETDGGSATSFRYERKFLVEELDRHQVQAIVKLHPGMFVQAYPPRFVNNLYLDSEELENYVDNVSGVGDRCKVRIRWYGDLLGSIERSTLEFKIKRGLVGTKEQYPLGPILVRRGFANRDFVAALQSAALPDSAKARIRNMSVVLLNRYYRWYYATVDGRYRLTIDTAMTFYHVGRLQSSFAHRQVDHTNIVVELKYPFEHEAAANRIAGYFPFRVTRSSKYVQGMDRAFM